MNNFDIEHELTKIMAAEIAKDIDEKIMKDILEASGGVEWKTTLTD
jgi:hypothetical protein